ncbi:MAG: tRNA pseudouridine(38-40) synthase TruA [Candidatus Dependentiae bacterium]|nr:tRNA pseudouridine(38-40) synthase TruA [Candidatus Dependentiae bacterium]
MNRYKIIIAYDGTGLYGWAQQPGLPSVTQIMQDTFYDIFKQKIALVGASRTDAGVHALGQVARFHTSIPIDVKAMHKAWSARLPGSLVIRSLEPALEHFHPFHGIHNKTYYYHFFLTRPLPFLDRYGLYCQGDFDKERFNEVLQLFVGTHDFTSFSTGLPIGDNPLCTIETINVHYFRRLGMYQVSITGNRFLRHMVRRLIGAALLSAQKKDKISVADIKIVLEEKNSNHFLPNAPAKGLLLYKIRYSGL